MHVLSARSDPQKDRFQYISFINLQKKQKDKTPAYNSQAPCNNSAKQENKPSPPNSSSKFQALWIPRGLVAF
ncbi:hypothetical protein V2J09_022732 [Rumex salicifolius]